VKTESEAGRLNRSIDKTATQNHTQSQASDQSVSVLAYNRVLLDVDVVRSVSILESVMPNR
jgi:hypothetical protein